MVDSNKNKKLIYETNLTMQILQIRHGQWFGVQHLILDLKIFGDSEDFIFARTLFPNFARRFIMDSVPKKTVRNFLVGRWTPLLSS